MTQLIHASASRQPGNEEKHLPRTANLPLTDRETSNNQEQSFQVSNKMAKPKGTAFAHTDKGSPTELSTDEDWSDLSDFGGFPCFPTSDTSTLHENSDFSELDSFYETEEMNELLTFLLPPPSSNIRSTPECKQGHWFREFRQVANSKIGPQASSRSNKLWIEGQSRFQCWW